MRIGSPSLTSPSPVQMEQVTPVETNSLEALFHSAMMVLVSQSRDFLELQKNLIEAEKAWQDAVYKELEKATVESEKALRIHNATAAIAKTFAPLTLFATGIASAMTGPGVLFSVAVAALGGLLTLDSLLDDAAKKTVASFLSRASGESQEAWLGRVHFFAGIVSFAASLGVGPHRALSIASAVAKTSLTCVQTGADIRKDMMDALLKEIEQNITRSEDMLTTHVEALKKVTETLQEFIRSMSQVYASLRMTTSMM